MKSFISHVLALFVLALFSAGGTALSESRPVAPDRLTILTYNIHRALGNDGKLDVPRIAEVIRKTGSDIVALQEVDVKTKRSRRMDLAAELGKLLEMKVAFGPALNLAGGQYGVAVLTKHELSNPTTHKLPKSKGKEQRVLLETTITVGSRSLRFYCTHFDHTSERERLGQVKAIADLTKNLDVPALLAGDLNAGPGSRVLRELEKDWINPGKGKRLPTFPAQRPGVQIDFILFRDGNGFRPVSNEVIREPVASDHAPLKTVLDWPK